MKSEHTLGPAVGLVILVVLTWKIMARGMYPASAGPLLTILDGANLIFHEAGHIILLLFGEFLHYLGGSLMQVLIPALCAVHFWRRQQRASSAVAIFWTGQSLTNVAIYIADARRMELPLIGGDHDWNYLLSELNLLNRDESMGRLVFFIGMLLVWLSLIFLFVALLNAWNRRERAKSDWPELT
jgi:hypothetical protein